MPLLQILIPGLIRSQRLSCFQERRECRSTCFSRYRDQAWDRKEPAESLSGRSQEFSTESASPTVNHQEADLLVCQDLDPGSTEEPGTGTQVAQFPVLSTFL